MSHAELLLPLWLIAALVGAATALAIARYGAPWLADVPRRHSSHARPVPRAGGLGIPVAVVVALWGASSGTAADTGISWAGLIAAIGIVAGIGLFDDLFELPVWPRLVAHALAALSAALALATLPGAPPWGAAAIGLATLGIAWSINLHNFMDGADGLLALHAVVVLAALAGFGIAAGSAPLALLAGVGAAATLGFLPFNLPRARVFLGDSGSGSLGLLIALGVLLGEQSGALPLAAGLCLASGFSVDAGATLLLRMLRGRRWYTRHREHLYQWLLRAGAAHVAVATAYALWTACIALPVACYARSVGPDAAWLACGVLHLVAGLAWAAGKRSVLSRARPMES